MVADYYRMFIFMPAEKKIDIYISKSQPCFTIIDTVFPDIGFPLSI